MMLRYNNQGIIIVFVVAVSLLKLFVVHVTVAKPAFVVVELHQIRRNALRHNIGVDPVRCTISRQRPSRLTELNEQKNPMKRPLLDQIATTLFNLETKRVESSSVVDEQGRYGEPMEWSNRTSLANQFSVMIASNPIGYTFKQTVANLIAGDYNEEQVTSKINQYVQQDTVVMFSFTTCPFCRKAKDILDERNVKYTAIELDTFDDNEGNIIRAQLGKLTKRTSMPNIFIRGNCVGGCNDGYPGLIPLIESDQFDAMLL